MKTAVKGCDDHSQETVEEAARVMYKRKVKRLPVVDAQGEVTGSVILGEFLGEPPPSRD